MNILIFSDTHLTHKFNKDLFDYIVKLIKKADQVVINGDFWDAYLTTFDSFCKSKWQKLFKLLKNKNTVYVTGNHDKFEYLDKRVKLFSSEVARKYILKFNKKSIIIQHGHIISPSEDNLFLFRNVNLTRPFYKFFVYLKQHLKIFRDIVNYLYQDKKDQKQLDGFINYVKSLDNKNEEYIFGHCHIKYQDKNLGIYSCGFLKEAQFSYVMLNDDKINLN